METTHIKLSKEEFNRGEIPRLNNHVLVRMTYSTDGVKTKGGVILGFNKDLVYAEGDNAWNADLQEIWGIVERVPKKLYYNKKDHFSMDWECDMELEVGDKVWGGLIEFANASEILCEGITYKLIPYADLYVAKRGDKVIPLNGYVLMQTVNREKISDLDVTSEQKIDKTKGIIKFVGKPNRRYKINKYVDFPDLKVNDEVVLADNTPFLYLERKKYLSHFDGDNLYVVIPRKKILAVINR